MTKSSPPPVERAFTLIELLVVIATIIILFAIATPVFNSVLERAKVTKDSFPGSATVTWMSQFELNQKYLSAWRVLESPFDARATSELGNATTAISYGINSNVYSGGAAISADKITKPVTFIVFAPAQDNTATVKFQGLATTSAPGVTVLGNSNTVTSNPGGIPMGGTQNSRTKINALCADWHVETMAWSGTGPAFTHTSDPGGDPDAQYRWSP